jgi:hypothetical protein
MTTPLSKEEYERRSTFCASLKTMEKSEFVEIARILKKHNVPVSENRSGMFFDLATISQEIFEEILIFKEFVSRNTKELEKRDKLLVDATTQRAKASVMKG